MNNDQDRIEKVVELSAPVARVWRAITDHQEFGEWFRVRLDSPFEVGVTTTGNMTYPGYEDLKWVSTTERMEHGDCLSLPGRQVPLTRTRITTRKQR